MSRYTNLSQLKVKRNTYFNGYIEAIEGTYEDFATQAAPLVACKANGAGACTGTAGDVNVMSTGKTAFNYCIKGTQTIVCPVYTANGLNIGMDQTDNDGVEITQGILSNARHAYTVGTDSDFYISVKFSIEDVSGTDDCAVGFRKAEAYQANIDDYDEMACLNVISGDIKIETILNNAATTTTDTTNDWADGETHTLEVRVSKAGVVTYFIDGTAPKVTAAFTFDNAEVVVPFMFMLNSTDVVGEVALKEWKVSYV